MITATRKQKRALAIANFYRSILYLGIAGAAMVVAAIIYLAQSGDLTGTLVFTVTVGVFVSILLGGGLMAAGFFSSSSGHDEEVAAAADGEADPTNELVSCKNDVSI